jgi:uncharacterized protein
MKSIFLFESKFRAFMLAAAVAVILCAAALPSFAQVQVPANTGYVNDNAGVIDASTKRALEDRLKALHDSSDAKIEIAILTVRTTGDTPIFDYSLAVAREWKIGSTEQDNPGVLLVVAVDDHKYFTQVSRDAEGDLPDGLVGQIQRQYLVPAFKQAQYGKGIQDTVEAYIARFGQMRNFDPKTLAKTEGKQPPPLIGTQDRNSDGSIGTCAICGCIIGVIIIIFVISSLSGAAGAAKRSSWNGGGFGGAAGKRKSGTASDIAGSALPWVIGGIISSLGSGGSGGSSDSGGSSGGGSDWGGFGGGGDFGGGGAGGDW